MKSITVNQFNKSNIVSINNGGERGALVTVSVTGARKALQQIFASVRWGSGTYTSNPNFFIRLLVCTKKGNLDQAFASTEFSPLLGDSPAPYLTPTIGDLGLVKYDQVWTYPFKSSEVFRQPLIFDAQEDVVVFCSFPVHADGTDTGTFPASNGYILHLSANGEVIK